jgi:hypothetical protein
VIATAWPLRQRWASATDWLTSNPPALSEASDPDLSPRPVNVLIAAGSTLSTFW